MHPFRGGRSAALFFDLFPNHPFQHVWLPPSLAIPLRLIATMVNYGRLKVVCFRDFICDAFARKQKE
jgi:hypothetical protein